MRKLLIVFTLLALLTLPALAQTPESTAVATPDATAEATPEAETPVTESEFTSWYIGILSQLIDLIKMVVGAVGVYAVTRAWRNPEQGKQYVAFGIGVMETFSKLTPTPKDDELFKNAREWWESLMKETKEVVAQAATVGAKAAVADAMAEERAKLAAQTGNKVEAFNIVPPHNPVS